MHVLHELKQEEGFSLTELLVVLVIIGVLVALLALPRFLSVTTKAKMMEARVMLKQVHSLEKAYYFEYDRYTTNLLDLGFEQSLLTTEGGSAYYRILVDSIGGARFVATATSVVDFDSDGTLNVWQVNQDGRITETIQD